MNDRIRTEVITITPEMAAEILTRGGKNFRSSSHHTVSKYARDMRNNRWHLNGVPLLFNRAGECIDGQHRLLACIEADTPFTTMVIYGVEDSAGVDEGRARSASQWLSFYGVSSSKDVAAITRLCILHESDELGKHMSQQISNAQVLEYYKLHANRIDDAARCVCHQRVIPRAILGCVVFCGTRKAFALPSDSETANNFISGIQDGVNLDCLDPRLALRNRVYAVSRHERIEKISLRAIVIVAWNKFVDRRPVKQIKWAVTGKASQDFPQIRQAIL